MEFIATEIIQKKKRKQKNTDDEIFYMVNRFTSGEIPDYQMSAWLMAICIQGFDGQETLALTRAMRDSGPSLPIQQITHFKIDKHSTGGVGDKTTLIIAPLMALTEVVMPTIAGRGLGHTGGTVDKLQSIPGFEFPKTTEKLVEHLGFHNAVFLQQTEKMCPADRKMYQLRDATGTVDSVQLIVASILSKKLSENINGLVLDVKVGNGAFMKTLAEAKVLGEELVKTAKGFGLACEAVLSNMNQPLGRFMGNSLEVMECMAILKGEHGFTPSGIDLYADTRELSLDLAARMHFMAKKSDSVKKSRAVLEDLIANGKAIEKFEKLIRAQNGNLKTLPLPRFKLEVRSTQEGFVAEMDTKKIGLLGILIKAGRQKITDTIMPTSGIEFHCKIGHKIAKNDIVFTLHGDDKALLNKVADELRSTVKFVLQKPATPDLILMSI